MSKAHKSTTKKASKSSSAKAMAELRGIVVKVAGARTAYLAAIAELSRIEASVILLAPKRPDPNREMPADIQAEFDGLTVAQFKMLPPLHPYRVWNERTGAAYAAELAKYELERAAIEKQFGLPAADRAVARTAGELGYLAGKALRHPATGLEAVALKLRAIRLHEFEIDHDGIGLHELLPCLDATLAQAGLSGSIAA